MRPSSSGAGSLVAFVFPALLAASSGATNPAGAVPAAPGSTSPAVRDVQWRANLAELDPATGELVLTGDVAMRLERLELGARRMRVHHESGTAPRSLSGEGHVSVRIGATSATAQRFELDLRGQRLSLEGPVRVSVAGGWTQAERAEVDTHSGKLTLHRVQGSLPFAPERALTQAH